MERPAEWESRWWSPIINAEHLAMRDACGLVDLSAFTVLDVTGPGALAGLQNLAVAQLDVPVGRIVYTPFLNEAGGFVADLTIMRLGASRFRVVTGAADGGRDAKWIADHLPDDAQLTDVSSAWATIGLWGPRAGDVLASVKRMGTRVRRVPFGISEFIEIGGAVVLASRISYVGEFGWELHVPAEQAGQLWDLLRDGRAAARAGAGRDRRVRDDGAAREGVPGVRRGAHARVQPGRGRDDAAPGQAAVVHRQGRVPGAAGGGAGRGAVHADRGLAVSADGTPRYTLGGEPILALDGSRLVDALGRPSYVTSAGSGPSVGKHLLMAYLPPAVAAAGTSLLVEYMGEPYPVTVAGVGGRVRPVRLPDAVSCHGRAGLCQAGADGRRRHHGVRRRAVRGYPDVRFHDQPA